MTGQFFAGAKLVSKYKRSIGNQGFVEYRIDRGNMQIFIEEIATTPAFAEKFRALQYKTIEDAYVNRPTPYTGASSAIMVCPKEFLPTKESAEFQGKKIEFLVAGASARNGLGACHPGMVEKKAVVFVGYNRELKTAVHVRVFIRQSDFKPEILRDFAASLSSKELSKP